jgi:RHS repeat-associated protein
VACEFQRCYTYDQYNNLTSKTYIDPYNNQTENYRVNTATNRRTGGSIAYDAAGNLTSMGTFDGEGRLTASGNLTYLYDGNSNRLRKKQGTTKIYYIYSATGKLMVEDNWTASTTKNQIYFAGQLIASRDQSDYVRLLFKDHLGSTRSVVTITPGTGWEQNWETTEVYYYRPFHGPTGSGSTTQRLTGKEHDENSLEYFGARYYDGYSSGSKRARYRWMSADSVTAHIYDPQSLNKYTYVRNNPVNFIDPDGRTPGVANSAGVYDDEGVTIKVEVPVYIDDWQGPLQPPSTAAEDNPLQITTTIPGPWQAYKGGIQTIMVWDDEHPRITQIPVIAQTLTRPTESQGNSGISGPSGTSWYKNPCILSALGNGALHVGIDALGLIPAGGGIARVLGHQAGYRGVVADQLGNNITNAVRRTASTTSFLSGLRDMSPQGLISKGLFVAGILVPGYSQAFSAISMASDFWKTGQAITQCH